MVAAAGGIGLVGGRRAAVLVVAMVLEVLGVVALDVDAVAAVALVDDAEARDAAAVEGEAEGFALLEAAFDAVFFLFPDAADLQRTRMSTSPSINCSCTVRTFWKLAETSLEPPVVESSAVRYQSARAAAEARTKAAKAGVKGVMG